MLAGSARNDLCLIVSHRVCGYGAVREVDGPEMAKNIVANINFQISVDAASRF